jgi:SNF2 family DNA or RNA helicase
MYDPDDGRYAQACLSAFIECANYHPTQNCGHPRWIRLRVDGADWQTAEVGTALRRLTALPQKTKDGTGDMKVPLTWAMVTQLSKLMEEHGYLWRPDEYLNKWIGQEFIRRHTEYGSLSDLAFDVSKLGWTPMPHQLAGMYVGTANRRLFFGDEAGTGKTRTALLTLAELEARGEAPFPAFVVCPASVADQWLEELEETFPNWPVVAYRGPRRKNLSSRYRIYVMSWDTFRADMKHEDHELPSLLKFLVPKTVVLDEAHCLCSKSKQSTAAKQIARVAEFAFLLSGTPITKDVGGFWSALQVLDIRSFPDEDRFKDRYTDRYHNDYGQDTVTGLSPATLAEFHLLMQGSMRRVAKQDVLVDLPPKTYVTRIVQIPAAHRAAYDEMAEDMLAHLPDGDEPLEAMSTLAQLQRLTQLASSACDVDIEEVIEERENHPMFGQLVPRQRVTMKEPSWKIDELMQILSEMQGSPLITFSPHTQLVKLAGARAERAGYRVGYITGQETNSAKTSYRKAFQAGGLDLLCCNTAAGGVGLNLTAASTAVFLERTFAYWQASQNEDRIHRHGQAAEQVTIIDIVAANSVESRVRQAMKDKSKALSELVRDPRIVEGFLRGQDMRVK